MQEKCNVRFEIKGLWDDQKARDKGSSLFSMGKTYTKSSTLSCYFETVFVIFYIIMFPFVLVYSISIFGTL